MHKNFQIVKGSSIYLYLIMLLVLSTCKESGNIGAGFLNESSIETDTVFISDLSLSKAVPYTGKLVNSPIGIFDDPLYGKLYSTGYFKPSIAKENLKIGDLSSDTKTILNLKIDINNIYGSQSTKGGYKVYRVGDLWRGSAFRMGDDLKILKNIDDSLGLTEVGKFEFADIDTTGSVEFELNGTWNSDFIRFYNTKTLNRDSTYRNEDFGLVIIPDYEVDKIIYARFGSTKLTLISEVNEDSTTQIDTTNQAMYDWAYNLDIEESSSLNNNINISNTFDPYIKLNLNPIVNQLSNNNFIRAEIVLVSDSTSMNATLNNDQKRTEDPPFRVQLGPSSNIAYDLGFNNSNSKAIVSSGVYRFDITGLLNANLFGETDLSEIYLYAGQNLGYLGFNTFYGLNSDLENVPKVILYNIVEED